VSPTISPFFNDCGSNGSTDDVDEDSCGNYVELTEMVLMRKKGARKIKTSLSEIVYSPQLAAGKCFFIYLFFIVHNFLRSVNGMIQTILCCSVVEIKNKNDFNKKIF
jgi:hypothetical protein